MIDRLLARLCPAPEQSQPMISNGSGLRVGTCLPPSGLVTGVQNHPLGFIKVVRVVELYGSRLTYWRARWAIRNFFCRSFDRMRGQRWTI